jgi:hypothetical protein
MACDSTALQTVAASRRLVNNVRMEDQPFPGAMDFWRRAARYAPKAATGKGPITGEREASPYARRG